jgi:hypothetical protein
MQWSSVFNDLETAVLTLVSLPDVFLETAEAMTALRAPVLKLAIKTPSTLEDVPQTGHRRHTRAA